MKCPHCGVEFHVDWARGLLTRGRNPIPAELVGFPNAFWEYRLATCPACRDVTIDIGIGQMQPAGGPSPVDPAWQRVRPIGAHRTIPSPHIPAAIASDYQEACKVLALSPKASAALSRRCLQHMLRDHGYKGRDLAHEIDAILAETDPQKALGRRVREAVDDIRHFGNFAAHPTINKATLDVIDVEAHEAETCLDTIEQLFEHFYVGPAEAKAKRVALNAKLAAAGKPPAKS